MFFKEYLLFRDGWDEDAETEIDLAPVEAAASFS
jgi:hypothetical protein